MVRRSGLHSWIIICCPPSIWCPEACTHDEHSILPIPEPWVGDHMADPTLLTPGVADARNLEPLWNKGNNVIRSVDNTTIVFFEGPTYGNVQLYKMWS